MKTYNSIQSLRRKINQTTLRFMDYTIVMVDGKYTAEFVCLSDLEKKTVVKEGFMTQ